MAPVVTNLFRSRDESSFDSNIFVRLYENTVCSTISNCSLIILSSLCNHTGNNREAKRS